MRILAGLMTASALSLMGAAWATPPGVTEKDGAFVAPDGKALYTFARDTTPGKSACNGQCATNWPPLAAAADAKDDGQWSVVTRDDGAKMWAYKGKPLYTYVRDTAGQPASGVGPAWPLAVK
jgi:predicted lipoprotein with Yx(FWY)xxD motif